MDVFADMPELHSDSDTGTDSESECEDILRAPSIVAASKRFGPEQSTFMLRAAVSSDIARARVLLRDTSGNDVPATAALDTCSNRTLVSPVFALAKTRITNISVRGISGSAVFDTSCVVRLACCNGPHFVLDALVAPEGCLPSHVEVLLSKADLARMKVDLNFHASMSATISTPALRLQTLDVAPTDLGFPSSTSVDESTDDLLAVLDSTTEDESFISESMMRSFLQRVPEAKIKEFDHSQIDVNPDLAPEIHGEYYGEFVAWFIAVPNRAWATAENAF